MYTVKKGLRHAMLEEIGTANLIYLRGTFETFRFVKNTQEELDDYSLCFAGVFWFGAIFTKTTGALHGLNESTTEIRMEFSTPEMNSNID